MAIDWNQIVSMQATPIIGAAQQLPPDFTGTLRTAWFKSRSAFRDCEFAVFTDNPINGLTCLSRAAFEALGAPPPSEDSRVQRQIEAGEDLMVRYRDVFAELAK